MHQRLYQCRGKELTKIKVFTCYFWNTYVESTLTDNILTIHPKERDGIKVVK